jgi:mannan endo-1,4-beta-mannosidase
MVLRPKHGIKIPVILAISAFAAIGAARLIFSSAAMNDVTAEAESGTLSGVASIVADAQASNGKSVVFGAEATPTPTPTPPVGARSTMYVQGRHLYSAAGEKVTLHGVNEMFIWMQQNTWGPTLAEIAKTNANVVRLVWDTNGTPAALDTLIQLTLQNKMIPYGELHGATGNISAVPAMVDYWVRPEVVSVIKKHEKWFLLNIANEAGGSGVSDATFLSTNQTAITRIRNAGINVPIIIDGTQWAMNHTQLWRTWQTLQEHDPLHNLMFSIHSYYDGSDTSVKATYDAIAAKVVADSIPIHIGEGPTAINASCAAAPYEYWMQKLQENDIGWITWSWGKANNQGCGPNSKFDITTDGVFGNWEYDHARIMIVDSPYSLKNVSVRPTEFR